MCFPQLELTNLFNTNFVAATRHVLCFFKHFALLRHLDIQYNRRCVASRTSLETVEETGPLWSECATVCRSTSKFPLMAKPFWSENATVSRSSSMFPLKSPLSHPVKSGTEGVHSSCCCGCDNCRCGVVCPSLSRTGSCGITCSLHVSGVVNGESTSNEDLFWIRVKIE